MMEKKKVCVLGSTGSVGKSTLDVLRQCPERFDLKALACGRRVKVLAEQIKEFGVRLASVADESAAAALRLELGSENALDFLGVGPSGHEELVRRAQPHVLMASMLGTYGLKATIQAIQQNVEVLGVANKEILVMAGPFIQAALKSSSTRLIPVDSEHSAIFQAFEKNSEASVRRVLLTASGGPFRDWPQSRFSEITKEDALKHPNWVMGAKITIDSATMMNKGLEFIEALQLFPISREQLEIVVHPESLIHSMVEYHDHSIIAQLGLSDMKIPISYALGYPERVKLEFPEPLDFTRLAGLHFEKVDWEKFPCLRLALEAEKNGLAACVVLNAANERAVEAFLSGAASFVDIPKIIEAALSRFATWPVDSLEKVEALDEEVKNWLFSRQNEGLLRAGSASSRKPVLDPCQVDAPRKTGQNR